MFFGYMIPRSWSLRGFFFVHFKYFLYICVNFINMENQQEQLSPEQLEMRRVELDAHYKKTIPFLKKQLEYEELLTKIEETRANRFMIQVKVAQFMAPEPEEEPNPDSAGDPTSRKLKKA